MTATMSRRTSRGPHAKALDHDGPHVTSKLVPLRARTQVFGTYGDEPSAAREPDACTPPNLSDLGPAA